MHQQRFDSRPGKAPLAIGLVAGACAAALALSMSGCGSSSSDSPGSAGMSGSSGGSDSSGGAGDGQTGGSATGGTTGAGGTSAGTAGTNGAAGTGGSSATGAGGGGAAGTGGSSAGRGGAGGSSGGSGGGAGSAGSAGTSGRGGTTGTAGSAAGRGGTTGTAGSSGGAAGTGGATGTGGTAAPACSVAAGPRCSGAMAQNPNPFGCSFAWGRQSPSGSGALSGYNYLQMVANWVESGVRADGTFSSCSGCSWLQSRVAGTNLIPVYYAYMIGFYGHMNGLPDQNQAPNGANLSTGGAALIKANRAKIINMYASYAQQTHAVWGSKPLVWFLEGDFIQYTATTQTSPLTMAELGQLAADITCAIKSNMPNAVVAINHTTWNADADTNSFWCEMKRADYDLVWTTGVGNNGNFIESAGKAGYYNAGTATYPYVHTLTGRTIAVDTSYGASAMSDSWSNQPVNVLNNHIMNGVIGVNISSDPPSNYQTLIQAIGQLATTCH